MGDLSAHLGLAAFASNLSIGVWLAAWGGSGLFAFGAVAVALSNRRRRLVRALRRATVACVVELMGLAAMVLIDNPKKWSALPWLLSILPFVIALLGVGIASWRGEARRPARARQVGPVPERHQPALQESAR